MDYYKGTIGGNTKGAMNIGWSQHLIKPYLNDGYNKESYKGSHYKWLLQRILAKGTIGGTIKGAMNQL